MPKTVVIKSEAVRETSGNFTLEIDWEACTDVVDCDLIDLQNTCTMFKHY